MGIFYLSVFITVVIIIVFWAKACCNFLDLPSTPFSLELPPFKPFLHLPLFRREWPAKNVKGDVLQSTPKKKIRCVFVMFCSNLTLCFHESPLSPSDGRWSAGPNLVMVYLCVFSSSRVQEWYSLRSSLQWQHVSSFWLWYLVCTVYIVPPFYLIRSGTPSEQLISSRHLLAFPGFTARLRVACLKSVITCTVVGQGQTCRMGRSEPDPNPGILKIEVYTHILYVYIYEVDNGWSNVDDFIFYFFFFSFYVFASMCMCGGKCVVFFTTFYVFGLLVTSETACYSVTIIFFVFMGIFWSVRDVAVLHVRVPGKFFLYPRYGPVKPNQNQPNNSNCTLITS